jgi:small subunit ribosomal protein S21
VEPRWPLAGWKNPAYMTEKPVRRALLLRLHGLRRPSLVQPRDSKRPANRGLLTLTRPAHNEGAQVQVLVRDNNVDQALKALKKKMQREGIFREMKLRGHYEKPSEKKAREKAEAIRRARKLARKKMQREGLLPMKPKTVPGAGGPGAGGRGGRSAAPRFG